MLTRRKRKQRDRLNEKTGFKTWMQQSYKEPRSNWSEPVAGTKCQNDYVQQGLKRLSITSYERDKIIGASPHFDT